MDGGSKGNKFHEVYHTGLRNQHALEMTAIELTERQVERLEQYTEMAARLRQHHLESQEQARRLEAILERHGTTSSSAKKCGDGGDGECRSSLARPGT
jgi:ferritin-like metal-binding protein YciE